MVYVFKTNVGTKVAVKRLTKSLDNLLFITKWNFDLDDYDNILRIEAPELDTEIICKLLKFFGFSCIELL